MSKNLRKVQDMLDGNYKNKIQSGYETSQEHRLVGDEWVDSDGYKWIQHDGWREKVRTMPSVGYGSPGQMCRQSRNIASEGAHTE